MRRLMLAAILGCAVSGAEAADLSDLPILRGPVSEGLSSSSVNWQGFYVGGQVGWGAASLNHARANGGLASAFASNPFFTSFVAPVVPGLGKSSDNQIGYGAFAGYNAQWDDVVLGLEGSFLHGNFKGSSTGLNTNIYTDGGYQNTVNYASSSSLQLENFGTIRARAGYVTGPFLPYAFAGIGLGQADIARSLTVTASGTGGPPGQPTYGPVSVTTTGNLPSHFVYGYSFGAGVDVMLIGGLFARAEFEYLRITTVVETNISTVRGGLGYKF